MIKLWHKLFLEERPSISLSFFRIWVAITVGAHVLPTFCQMGDNYFSTALKVYNLNFFTPEVVAFVQKSPDAMVVVWVWIFCISWFFFLIGLKSQLSCLVMTIACYYFYALNSFHIGTLSWDILLVTLFLMCVTSYHGDYFSVDCLWKGREDAYRQKRPFFIQRLLQMQIAFNYFYTGLYKITADGNWLTANPIYYLMNYPPAGVTKMFILKDYLMDKPQLCYWIGIAIVITELSMPILLFWRRTRVSAIYLGIFFHILLLLTLDVPSIFFLLFPAQLLLFINPNRVVEWIEQRRAFNASTAKQSQLLYDGHCQFCLNSVRQLKIMDLFGVLNMVDFQPVIDLETIHPSLSKEKAYSQLHLIESNGKIYGGFEVFRRLCLAMPMLYPLIPIFYFPGMSFLGAVCYKFAAKNRYWFHFNPACKNNSCFR